MCYENLVFHSIDFPVFALAPWLVYLCCVSRISTCLTAQGRHTHGSMCTISPCLLVGESAQHANAGSLSFSQLTTSVTFTGQLTRLATENHDCWPGQSTDGTSLGVSAQANIEHTRRMHLQMDMPLNSLLMQSCLAAACSCLLVNTLGYLSIPLDTYAVAQHLTLSHPCPCS